MSGRRLAHDVAKSTLSGAAWSVVLALLPRMHDHRDELAAALRDTRKFDRVSWHSNPEDDELELLAVLARSRDAARLVGDTREVDRLQPMIERHIALYDDDRRMAALEIWTLASHYNLDELDRFVPADSAAPTPPAHPELK